MLKVSHREECIRFAVVGEGDGAGVAGAVLQPCGMRPESLSSNDEDDGMRRRDKSPPLRSKPLSEFPGQYLMVCAWSTVDN
ncbi:unnamed protein product [Parnassius apollo]|uniref:(apollo) hypothetical protein n=1 Tax=Parnassius apollo TaxID=110799 RepID=A0A8S3W1K5_PARAO|nr:unnamed protein product [Parnassius apollo]